MHSLSEKHLTLAKKILEGADIANWKRGMFKSGEKAVSVIKYFPRLSHFFFKKLIKLLIFMFSMLPSRSIKFLRLLDELKMK